MKGLEKHNVFFIGIGGIGMSALARWFRANGYEVVGYDKTSTALTNRLLEEGIVVHYMDSPQLIPDFFTTENTLVIYTPAIPGDHNQLNYFINAGFEVKKRSEVLGLISNKMFSVAVAGTHGKTTTSSMIAHILHESGLDTTAFLGGIAANFDSNLLLGKSDETIAVIEADEYDRSFLRLTPDLEVITSADPDHLDIYGDHSGMLESYTEFAGKLKENGRIFISESAQEQLSLNEATIYGENAPIKAVNIRVRGNLFVIDYRSPKTLIEDIQLNLPGQHNTENALAAITIALELGVKPEAIKEALKSFKGIKRRFEFIIDESEFKFIDDYAHHPEEVAAFISTLRDLYPDKFIQVIFQPHLFSRTQDFAEDFAHSLDLANNVILMDIYPARELPIPGVTSELILDQVKKAEKSLLPREEIGSYVEETKPDILATVGAGNIDTLVPELKELLTKPMTV